ncbi:MAG: ATP-binding protein, partial [Byssovorax sp.]
LVRLFDLSQGQPWLTNALTREIVEEMRVLPSEAITIEHVEQAKERLIVERSTHLHSLAARLQEPRVLRILEPVLAGGLVTEAAYNNDLGYVRDLGFVAATSPIRIANPIYQELIVRVLSASVKIA